VKARARAERAAARQATGTSVVPASQPSPDAGPPTPADNHPSPETPGADNASQDSEERRAGDSRKENTPDRTELLRSKPQAVGRFMQLSVPVLVDVYAASVYAPVRIKTLTALLKAVSFLDAEGLKRVLGVRLVFNAIFSYFSSYFSLSQSRALLPPFYHRRITLHSSLVPCS